MSIREFHTQLGKEKSSLFAALYQLSRIGDLKGLSFAVATGGGWGEWPVALNPCTAVSVA
jgi:hypothetical protein